MHEHQYCEAADADGKLQKSNLFCIPEGYVVTDLKSTELHYFLIANGCDLERTVSAFSLIKTPHNLKSGAISDLLETVLLYSIPPKEQDGKQESPKHEGRLTRDLERVLVDVSSWENLIISVQRELELRKRDRKYSKEKERALDKYITFAISDLICSSVLADKRIDLKTSESFENTLTIECVHDISSYELLKKMQADMESGECPTDMIIPTSSDTAFTLRKWIEGLTGRVLFRCCMKLGGVTLPEELIVKKVGPLTRLALFMGLWDSPGFSLYNPLQRHHRSTVVNVFAREKKHRKPDHPHHALLMIEGSSLLANVWVKHLMLEAKNTGTVLGEETFKDLAQLTHLSHCLMAKRWVETFNHHLVKICPDSGITVKFSAEMREEVSLANSCYHDFFRNLFVLNVPCTLFSRRCNTVQKEEMPNNAFSTEEDDEHAPMYSYYNYVYSPNEIYNSGTIVHELQPEEVSNFRILSVEGQGIVDSDDHIFYNEEQSGTWHYLEQNLLQDKLDLVVMKVPHSKTSTIDRLWSTGGKGLLPLRIASKFAENDSPAFIPRHSYGKIKPVSYLLDNSTLEGLELVRIAEFFYYPQLPSMSISNCMHVYKNYWENTENFFGNIWAIGHAHRLGEKSLKSLHWACHSPPYCNLIRGYLEQNLTVYALNRVDYMMNVLDDIKGDKKDENFIEIADGDDEIDKEILNELTELILDEQQEEVKDKDSADEYTEDIYLEPTSHRPESQLKTFSSTKNYPVIIAGVDMIKDILMRTVSADNITKNVLSSFYNTPGKYKWVEHALAIISETEDSEQFPLTRALLELPLYEMWFNDYFTLYSEKSL